MFGGMDLKDIETIGKLTLANTILLSLMILSSIINYWLEVPPGRFYPRWQIWK